MFLLPCKKYDDNYYKAVEVIESITQDIPIILQDTVKHGQWEISDIPCEHFKCSVCGGGAWYYDYERDISKSRYCPNCGAKMDMKS